MNKKVVVSAAIFIGIIVFAVAAFQIYRLTVRAIADFEENDTNLDNFVPEPEEITNSSEITETSNTTTSSSGGGSGGGGSGGGGGSSSSSSGGGGIPVPGSNIVRSYSPTIITLGENITITFSINLLNSETYYLIEEQISAGFEVLDYGTGNVSTPGYIKWIEYENAQTTNLSYVLNATQTGTFVFSGDYFIEGFVDITSIEGQNSISIV